MSSINEMIDLYFSLGYSDYLKSLPSEWLSRYPNNRGARLTAARVYARLGLFDRAEKEYRILLGELIK